MSQKDQAEPGKDARELMAESVERIKERDGVVVDRLTAKKVRERGEVVSFDAEEVVVDVERHRAILGETYSRGHKMDNFMRYWVRYKLDRATDTLTHRELDASDGRRPIPEIDEAVVADLQVSQFIFDVQPDPASGDVLVSESMSGEKKRVRTLDEAEVFARERASGGWDTLFYGLGDLLSSQKIKEHTREIERHATAKAAEMVREIW